MKKILLVALAFCFLQFAGNAEAVKADKSTAKCDACAAKFQKQISSCTKRAEYYRKIAANANQHGNKDLAGVFTKCANAKSKVASGLDKVCKSSLTCQKIYSKNPEIKSTIGSHEGVGQRKKRMRMTTHIKNIQECADQCLKSAKVAHDNAKPDLAEQYNQLAIALQQKAAGFEAVSEGKKEFKSARTELKKFKSSGNIKLAQKNK